MPGPGPTGLGSGTGTGGDVGSGGSGVVDPNQIDPPLTTVQLEQKAHATAWALTYYATKSGRMPSYHKYLAKLNELPRDLRVDRDVSLKLFCEAFGLTKQNTQEIDADAFNTFAKDWMKSIQQEPP